MSDEDGTVKLKVIEERDQIAERVRSGEPGARLEPRLTVSAQVPADDPVSGRVQGTCLNVEHPVIHPGSMREHDRTPVAREVAVPQHRAFPRQDAIQI